MVTCEVGFNYVVDLRSMFVAHDEVFCSLFTDGRPASFLSEKLSVQIFDNVFFRMVNGSPFDLQGGVAGRACKFEVKTVTKNGLKLVQSKSIGVGRNSNTEENSIWKDSIDYFLIVDCAMSGELVFSLVDAKMVEARAYTRAEAIRKFFNYPRVRI